MCMYVLCDGTKILSTDDHASYQLDCGGFVRVLYIHVCIMYCTPYHRGRIDPSSIHQESIFLGGFCVTTVLQYMLYYTAYYTVCYHHAKISKILTATNRSVNGSPLGSIESHRSPAGEVIGGAIMGALLASVLRIKPR